MQQQEIEKLVQKIRAGDRAALARGMTLVESSNKEDRLQAQALLKLLPQLNPDSFRIGICGSPGAGKSTFINTLGMHLISQGKQVAVLAIDPASTKTGGAILGDRTRMQELSGQEQAFIRPSSSRGILGGVAPRTRELIALCEAAGFDHIFVETVGTGQSEVQIAQLVDMCVLLVAPAAGDELQGIKRGILEIANLVCVTKADGVTEVLAQTAVQEYKNAMGLLLEESSRAEILACSSLSRQSIETVWQNIEVFRKRFLTAELKQKRREDQILAGLEIQVLQQMSEKYKKLKNEPFMENLSQQLKGGKIRLEEAAERVIDHLHKKGC